MRGQLFLLLLFLGTTLVPNSSFSDEIKFKGKLKYSEKGLQTDIEFDNDSSIHLVLHNNKTRLNGKAQLNHIKIKQYVFSTEIEGDVNFISKKDPSLNNIQGEIKSNYSILNYKPVRELSGKFFVKNGKLYIDPITFGKVSCKGSVELLQPHKVNFLIGLDQIEMNSFLDIWMRSRKFDSSGDVSGDIKVFGNLEQLRLRGSLASEHGYIKNLNFDQINLNLEGEYPILEIANSTISESDGFVYSIEGPINIKNTKKFKQQIKELKIKPLVDDRSSGKEWTLIQKRDDDSTTAIKYFLLKDADTGSPFDKETGMFGIEKSLEF